eukprot:1551340-Alexandrium_andersonii.AAC.1
MCIRDRPSSRPPSAAAAPAGSSWAGPGQQARAERGQPEDRPDARRSQWAAAACGGGARPEGKT